MLKLNNISRRLGEFSLSNISIDIADGEYYVLLGHSGSGKTQLLEMIAGLIDPDSGEIWIDNVNVNGKKIRNRNTGMVFQDYSVFPHMTVYGNIAYPLRCRKGSKPDINKKVTGIARKLNIYNLLKRSTQNLSQGELQRVALARTLVTSPRLLLLDEPLASIDASLKDGIKRLLREINRNGLTIIHVTHDYREAVTLATKVGVIHNGRIVQEGIPDEVFRKPANRFVARYAGIRNLFDVNIYQEEERWKACSERNLVFDFAGNDYPAKGLFAIRNNEIKIHLSKPSSNDENCFEGVIRDILPLESGMEITVDAGEIFYVDMPVCEFKEMSVNAMMQVWITFPRGSGLIMKGD